MRTSFSILFFLILNQGLLAQSLNGKIINGLGEEGLPNVRVEVSGFATDFSDQELGTFSLSLPGLRPGAKIPLDIAKEGYAVINREATQPHLPDNPLERVYIHLAPTDKRDELALSFYKINVERNIQVNFETAAKKFAEEANYEAIAKFELDQAQQYYEAAVAADTTDWDNLWTLCEYFVKQGQYQKLRPYSQRMRNIAQENRQIVQALIFMGVYLCYQNQAEAIDSLQKAAEICTYMKKTNPRISEEQLASVLINLATANEQFGRYDEVIPNYGQAVEILQPLAKEDTQTYAYTFVLALSGLGSAKSNLGLNEEGIVILKQAQKLIQKLVKENPQVYEPLLINNLQDLGSANNRLRRFEEGISFMEQALALSQKLAKANPLQFELDQAYTLGNLGAIHNNLQRYGKAASFLEQASELMKTYVNLNPQAFEPHLVWILNMQGVANRGLLQLEEARSFHTQAHQLLQKLIKEHPQSFDQELASTLESLGLIELDLERNDEAILLFEQGLKIYKRLAQADPQRYEPQVALSLSNLLAAWQNQLLSNPRSDIYHKGLESLSALDSSLSRCPDIPDVQSLKETAYYYRSFFETADLKELELHLPTYPLRDSVAFSSSLSAKIGFQQQLVASYEEILQSDIQKSVLTDSLLSIALDSLAKWQLFAQDFIVTVETTQHCADLSSDYIVIYRWQAPALLLQGKISQAKKVYNQWKDQPWPGEEAETFKEVFISDLKRLESTGISHPDIDKFKQILLE